MRSPRVLTLVFVTAAAFASATVARGAPESDARSFQTRAQRLLAEVNELRLQRGLVALRVSAGLTAAAREHSSEMAHQGYFGHESLDGSSLEARLGRHYQAAGHRFWAVGENLVWASPDLGATRALRLWLQSPPHRENLFTRGWREIGIGAVHLDAAPGLFGGAPVTIVTVDFGVRR